MTWKSGNSSETTHCYICYFLCYRTAFVKTAARCFGRRCLVSWLLSASQTAQAKEVRPKALQWRHNERESVSNHQSGDCLLNRLFRRRSKKTSKLRVTGLCAGNSPGTGEFSAQMASNAEGVSIWWRHHRFRMMPLPGLLHRPASRILQCTCPISHNTAF